ncbi:VOC family protein [Longispora urticae]
MTFSVRNIAFDCSDPYRMAVFWSQAFGLELTEWDQPGSPVAMVCPPGSPVFYFAQVPESKSGKNRVHVCLTPELARDGEVDRLLALGATVVADRRDSDGGGWAVLADPEGNEFCLLRSEAERAAAHA